MEHTTSTATANGVTPHAPRTLRSIACLIGIALVFFLLSDRRVAIYDGGLPLSLALRVFHGDVPHRDFYYQYGPAQPFLFAALFKLFGVYLLPIAIVEMVIKAGSVMLSFMIVRRVSPFWPAVYSASVVGLLLTTGYPSASMDALLPVGAFVAVSSSLLAAEPGLARSVRIGLLAALTGLYRYEQGPMLLVLFLLLLVAGWLLRSPRTNSKPVLWSAFAAMSAYAVITLPLFAYYMAKHALGDLWYQCFTFTRMYYRSARTMPFPTDPWHQPIEVVFYLPFLVPVVVLLYAVWQVRADRQKLATTRFTVLCLVSILALLYAVKGSIRVDFGQMLPGNFAVAILLGVLLSETNPLAIRRFAAVTAFVALLATTLDIKALLRPVQKEGELTGLTLPRGISRADIPGWCDSSSPLAKPFCFGMDADHERAAMFILQRVRPADRLYVGLSQHDVVFAGDNLTYMTTGTLPAVKWSELEPDLQTRADIQTEMISSLALYRPRFALQTSQYEGVHEPNDSSKSSGVTLLDEYLLRNYHPVAVFGQVTVLERRETR